MQACLFNIQRFSIHDGDGIRTTVFFKGCPLRCLWCSNPESIRSGPEVMWRAEKCERCGVCVRACPEGAVGMTEERVAVDRRRCTGCGVCAGDCPADALSVSGKMYGLEEVVRECLRDRDFYEESGGGVTLSGGEATAQADFAVALLRRLREEGVRTAVETNGFAGREVFRRVAEEADMILFDVKQHDSAKHSAGTGVDNGLILENLRWIVGSGRAFLVRIPVIRGFSDSLEDAAGFAGLLLSFGVDRAQLLPFHQMGEGKYVLLGMEYALADRPQLHREDLDLFKETMLAQGMREVII